MDRYTWDFLIGGIQREKSKNKQTRKENTKLRADRSLNGRTNAGECDDCKGRRKQFY